MSRFYGGTYYHLVFLTTPMKKEFIMSFEKREKVLFIINPKSGKMTLKNSFFDIITMFSDAGFAPTVLTTTKSGDATSFAREFGTQYDRIVACGGDGTLNEVVTGIMDIEKDKRPPLGFIPSGTTNDLADTLKIPKIPLSAAKSIIETEPTENDVISIDDV